MKRILLFLGMFLLLSGCGKALPEETERSTEETVLPTVLQTELQEPTVYVKDEDAAYMQLYAPVLDTYRQALTERWNQAQCAEAGISILTVYCMEGDNPLQNLCYAFHDLDGDGDKELLIAPAVYDNFEDDMVFDCYDLLDGQPRQLFCGFERIRYYLCYEDDGTCWIANEGSGGAGHSGWFYYLYDGEGLAIQQSVVFDADTSPDEPWFTGCDDSWELSKMKSVSETEAREMIESYERIRSNIYRGFNSYTFDMG